MSFFRRNNQPQVNNVQVVAGIVEKILTGAGIPPERARLPVEGLGWTFTQGSAHIEIYINSKDGKDFFQVLSPIMNLPQTGLLAFYRRLLELNMLTAELCFGVFGDTVYIFSERPLDGLDINEAQSIIAGVAQNADEWDDRLINEFGGRLYTGV
jgi:hypothetical protein